MLAPALDSLERCAIYMIKSQNINSIVYVKGMLFLSLLLHILLSKERISLINEKGLEIIKKRIGHDGITTK